MSTRGHRIELLQGTLDRPIKRLPAAVRKPPTAVTARRDKLARAIAGIPRPASEESRT